MGSITGFEDGEERINIFVCLAFPETSHRKFCLVIGIMHVPYPRHEEFVYIPEVPIFAFVGLVPLERFYLWDGAAASNFGETKIISALSVSRNGGQQKAAKVG